MTFNMPVGRIEKVFKVRGQTSRSLDSTYGTFVNALSRFG